MTTLMKYKPTTSNGMISLLDNIFNDDLFNWSPISTSTIDYDVIERDNEYVLDLALPGFTRENVTINVEDNVMTIEGERKYDEKIKYNRKGNFYGHFKKSFTLPEDVIAEKIDASFSNGILSIIVPKDEKAKLSKVIEIK